MSIMTPRWPRDVLDLKDAALFEQWDWDWFKSEPADAVVLRDPANNLKLAKARSTGRIDAAAASVLAVAEGARRSGRPCRKPGPICGHPQGKPGRLSHVDGRRGLPPEVLIVTAGVDCQDDRLELVFTGHGKGDATFILGHSVIWGAVDAETTWLELDDALRGVWKHPAGGALRVDAAVIDSGDGGHADLVHAFTRPRFGRRIVSGKGVPGFARPFIQRSGAKGAPLFLIGVDAIKAQLFQRLARGSGFRFSADLEPIFFEQLTSERRVVKYYKGQPVRRFERVPGKRAEALDAVVYALAARGLIGADLERRETEVASVTAPAKAATVIRSKWLQGE